MLGGVGGNGEGKGEDGGREMGRGGEWGRKGVERGEGILPRPACLLLFSRFSLARWALGFGVLETMISPTTVIVSLPTRLKTGRRRGRDGSEREGRRDRLVGQGGREAKRTGGCLGGKDGGRKDFVGGDIFSFFLFFFFFLGGSRGRLSWIGWMDG